jgi:hypothetical protein
MIADRELLKQALDELVRLKPAGDDPTRYQARLYTAALAEWADRLAMRPLDLDKLVLIREAIPGHHWR